MKASKPFILLPFVFVLLGGLFVTLSFRCEATTPHFVSISSSSSMIKNVDSSLSDSTIVRIGLCRDYHADDESRSIALELVRLFQERGKQAITVDTNNGSVPQGVDVPDVVICLGYFYSDDLVKPKLQLLESSSSGQFQSKTFNNVFYPKGLKAVKHERGRSFLVAFSGEPWDRGSCENYDLMFVTRSNAHFTDCALAYLPVISASFSSRNEQSRWSIVRNDHLVKKEFPSQLASRKKFMAFIVRTCYQAAYVDMDALIRIAFFDFVTENYKPVDGLGACRHSEGFEKLKNPDYHGDRMTMNTEIYEEYKFVLTFENHQMSGYVSEKILDAMLARSVPVYWGAHTDLLNPERYIRCEIDAARLTHTDLSLKWNAWSRAPERENVTQAEAEIVTNDYIAKLREHLRANFTECLKEIERLDTDKEAYLTMLRQPILPNNRLEGSIFDRRVQAKQIIEALQMQHSYLVSEW